jgi:hypothetical protein
MSDRTQEVRSQGTTSHEDAKNKRAQAAAIIEELRREIRVVWRGAEQAMKKPVVGAAVAGAAVLTAGALWGPTEAAVAAVAAYAVLRVLLQRRPPGGKRDRRDRTDELGATP